MKIPQEVRRALTTILGELLDGARTSEGWVLNPGDRGLLASLDAVTASAASARRDGRSSIAAHVDHLRYGFELLNRWAAGEENPFATADYAASWRGQEVDDATWRDLRSALTSEAREWLAAIQNSGKDVEEIELIGMIASAVHLAYHVGAIRQIDPATRGPSARD